MRRLIAVFFAIEASGCGGFSMREQMIRSHLPEAYRKHNSGIVAHPTDSDVNQAIQLGKMAKDDEDLLRYAYKLKPGEYTYIDIKTPLFYIAEHSFECACNYKAIDPVAVTSLRGSGKVGISVLQVYGHTIYYAGIAGEQKFVLLRDGVRVEPVTESALPFALYAPNLNFGGANTYQIEDLLKPGKLEVVYRTAQTGNLLDSGGEVKCEISLAGIR